MFLSNSLWTSGDVLKQLDRKLAFPMCTCIKVCLNEDVNKKAVQACESSLYFIKC